MRTLRTAAFLAALLPSLAAAQTFPQTLPANTVLGRLGVGPGPVQQIPFSALGPNLITNFLQVTSPLSITGLNLKITGTAGQVLYGSPPAFTATPQLGLASTTTGTITFANAGNVGTVTISAPSTATTWNLKFPTTAGSNGQALITDGSGNTSWAAGAGTVNSGTAGQVAYYATSAAAVSSNAALTFSGSIVSIGSGLSLGGATIGSNILAVTGLTAFNSAVTMSAALTYGGVTLNNGVTGTGNMVLSATPALTGVVTMSGGAAIGGATIGGNALAVSGTSLFNSGVTLGAALTYGGVTLSNAVTGTGNMVLATSPTVTGATLSSATISGATITTSTINGNTVTTGTGTLTLAAAKTLTASNTLTLAGTDTTTITFQGTDTYVGRTTTDTLTNKTLTAPTINAGTAQALTNLGIRSTGSGAFDMVLANTENLTAQRTLTLTVNNAQRTISLSGNITTAADFTTSGANGITLTTTGNTNVTLPTSGTLATRDTSQTFSGSNIFSALTQFTDIKLSSGKIYPTADGTTALQITKADGSTRIVNVDTTNARIGINKNAGAFDLDINGAVNVGGRITFGTLDGASLQQSPSTVTDITINNSPSSSNDYIPYYNASSGQIRRATIGSIAAAASGGVQNINGLCAGTGCTIAGATGVAVSSTGTTVTLTATAPTPQHRITLATGVPVMASSQAAATTVYVTPYGGNTMPIYDGTNVNPTAWPEVSQATTDATKSPAAVGASSIYDIYCWIDTGPTNRCTRGVAGGEAHTTLSNGFVVNTSSITNGPAAQRGTWMGKVCSDASSKINFVYGAAASGGTAAILCVWNAYNRVMITTNVTDNGGSYTYTTSTIRQAKASAGMQVTFLYGAQEDGAMASNSDLGRTVAAANALIGTGIGLDSTSTFTTCPQFYLTAAAAAAIFGGLVTSCMIPASAMSVGTHILSANQVGDNVNANTFSAGSVGNTLGFQMRM